MSDRYYPRPEIIQRVWSRLENNEHVLLPGPRRIGKTSLLYHLQKSPKTGYFPVYVITEAADSLNEFYRKLLLHLIDDEIIDGLHKWSNRFSRTFKKINIEEIGKTVKFGSTKETNYAVEFEAFVRSLELEGKIILMVDEFPQSVENIIEFKTVEEAKQLLQTQRELRNDPKVKENLLFIYAGSIGLENVAAQINSTKHINDLANIDIPALTKEQGLEFLEIELSQRKLRSTQDVKEYLLNSVEWLIPFYIREIVERLPSKSIEKGHIDSAIDELLACRNLFDHWHTRLRTSLSKSHYQFAKALLSEAADPEYPHISSAAITDMAVQHDVLENQPEIMGVLKHDGYLNNQEDIKTYRFNSPIVRHWWWRNITN